MLRHILIGAALGALFALSALGLAELRARSLPTTLELRGETRVLTRPVHLKNGESLTVIGPGRLEADISGETGSWLSLTNCVVMNLTRLPLEKSGIRYALLNNVYLNFANLSEPAGWTKRFNQFDGAFNEIRFKGPSTLDELNRLKNEENIRALRIYQVR